MNPIRTNKPVFFGDDGAALKSGNIYIGQPNQWPLSFPKTVTLQDSAGSQFTAEQPLKTGGDGRITYNGKAVIALVDGDYSILVRDRNGVTVGQGYTPLVSNTDPGAGTTEGVTQVGLLLSDIKQFDVTPGETVRNVGKSTTVDGLGADWLVVSNTGSAGDDTDLIDFDNGTQGKRNESFAYSKDVGKVTYQEVTIDGGDFAANAFTLKCLKIGQLVTLWTDAEVTHPSLSEAVGGAGEIPAEFLPAGTQAKTFNFVSQIVTVKIQNTQFRLAYTTAVDGTVVSRTGSIWPISITYGV